MSKSIPKNCPGSNRSTGGWPGDDDTCPVCERWIRVKADGRLRTHKGAPKRSVTVAETMGLGR